MTTQEGRVCLAWEVGLALKATDVAAAPFSFPSHRVSVARLPFLGD